MHTNDVHDIVCVGLNPQESACVGIVVGVCGVCV